MGRVILEAALLLRAARMTTEESGSNAPDPTRVVRGGELAVCVLLRFSTTTHELVAGASPPWRLISARCRTTRPGCCFAHFLVASTLITFVNGT